MADQEPVVEHAVGHVHQHAEVRVRREFPGGPTALQQAQRRLPFSRMTLNTRDGIIRRLACGHGRAPACITGSGAVGANSTVKNAATDSARSSQAAVEKIRINLVLTAVASARFTAKLGIIPRQ